MSRNGDGRTDGWILLEVVIALAVLSLLSGSLAALLQAVARLEARIESREEMEGGTLELEREPGAGEQ